jgi:hypothetical protein
LQVGESQNGFSFTTTVGPIGGAGNNYSIWDPDGGLVGFGHVVAPILAPEPNLFIPLLLLGISLIVLRARGGLRWVSQSAVFASLTLFSGNSPLFRLRQSNPRVRD